MERLEQQILANLIWNEDFTRKVAPFVVPVYFEDRLEKVITQEILSFFAKYNKMPTQNIIKIELANRKDITDKELHEAQQIVDNLQAEKTNPDWLLEKTEQFCKDRAVYNAILHGIKIIDGKDDKLTQEAIPKILQDALAVSFDVKTGHSYFDDAEQRYEFYHRKEQGIQFGLDIFDKITGGVGMRKKTLTSLGSSTGGGKSLGMCHITASALKQGHNVLYITLEMSEERIAERIDANLMNIPMNALHTMDKETFVKRVDKIRSKSHGKLIIKEYPTGSAHAGHFRALIEDLKIKQDFIPDLLVVDYLGICVSQRIKSSSANSYTILGSVAEELRSLGQEYNIPVLTGVQINRGGIGSSDFEITDTSDSMKIVHSLDLYLGFIRTPELDDLNQILVKVLKNRYDDPNLYKRFVIGFEPSKSLLYDVENLAQEDISDAGYKQDDAPMFDKSSFGKRQRSEGFTDFKY